MISFMTILFFFSFFFFSISAKRKLLLLISFFLFQFLSLHSHPYSPHSHPDSAHSHPYSIHYHSDSPHSDPILLIPCIDHIPRQIQHPVIDLKKGLLVKIVKDFKLQTIFIKRSILIVPQLLSSPLNK